MIASIVCHGYLPCLESYLKAALFLGYKPVTLDEICANIVSSAYNSASKYLLLTLDHPNFSMKDEVLRITSELEFRPTLYLQTHEIKEHRAQTLGWDEICELQAAGWTIGAHTHSHAGLVGFQGSQQQYVAEELERNNELIERYTGKKPNHFAYPGGALSREFEDVVRSQYASARLWTTSPLVTYATGHVSWNAFYGLPKTGAWLPKQAMYISNDCDPYRIPAMELTALLKSPEVFCAYLWGEDDIDENTKQESIAIASQLTLPRMGQENFEAKFCVARITAAKVQLRYVSTKDLAKEVFGHGLDCFIWGTGLRYSTKLKPTVQAHACSNFRGFIDNAEDGWGTEFDNKPVFSPKEIRHYPDVQVVISSSHVGAIANQLLELVS